ncbi:MAG TPA: PhoH family protein [Ignavibacteriales bacterium]|nr:PhoH family protein [Ignavibacteriales bacterium]HOL81994.1 PhoH family protein [Ignavibacteriales bacterium]HOM64962.1 PhoH family protein [Ignavibacteriales bacterium]HRR17817.1 PhoH family protein [Ignavibacteriales bacterium]HRT99643.1 PhoH family protein [Ignavibacteriales bacterium]
MQKEKYLNLDNSASISFLGANNSNLVPIEKRLNVYIIQRGTKFIIRGEDNEVNLAEKILIEMSNTLKLKSEITLDDVNNLIDLLYYSSPKQTNSNENSDVILYTREGSIKPKSYNQKLFVDAVRKNDVVFALGPAGTGKTYLAVALAVDALNKGNVQKIILSRPAVEAGESLGFLPGDIKDKIDPYLKPLYDALFEMMNPDKLKLYLEREIIEIVPLAFMRGRTLSKAFIILDEAQNSTTTQMKMFLTRLGMNSKVIITGDVTQIDLPSKSLSGILQAKKILHNIEGIKFVYFDKEDVVRHKLVKDIIQAYDNFSELQDSKNIND